jgi:hypothetical protein
MSPAGRLDDRTGPAPRCIETSVAGVGVGLTDAGIGGEVRFGVRGLPRGRVMHTAVGAVAPPNLLVVAHVGPQPPCPAFALGQHGRRRVVRVDAGQQSPAI